MKQFENWSKLKLTNKYLQKKSVELPPVAKSMLASADLSVTKVGVIILCHVAAKFGEQIIRYNHLYVNVLSKTKKMPR